MLLPHTCIHASDQRIGLAVAGLLLSPTIVIGAVIITSAQINAYFGTGKLVSPGGLTLFTQDYLFFSNPISPDLAAEITTDPNANAFPIFQNNVTAGATFDSTLFVQGINNGNCQAAGPLCDPMHPLPIFPADASLTAALKNLPVPSGYTLQTLIDTGDVFKGNLPDFVVFGPATDGRTIIQASINISLFEHDFTAIASPGAAVPEPATELLVAGAFAAACIRYRFTEQASARTK